MFLLAKYAPAESPVLVSLVSALWALGVVVGAPIGAALAANPDITWRWAFYVNLPAIGLGLMAALFSLPTESSNERIQLWRRVSRVDPGGILFNIAAPVLFALALTFSGSVWAWRSGEAIATWVTFGIVLIGWCAQQKYCIFTTPEQRAIPVHILSRRDLQPVWVASACAGGTYAVTMYYTPLFFAFARGMTPMQQTVRTLPFILSFIFAVMLTGRLLRATARYNLVFTLAGAVTLAGGAAMAATLRYGVSDKAVMGLLVVIGIGLGMHFQHGAAISNVINQNNMSDCVDSLAVFNLAQMGGIAVVLAIAGAVYENEGQASVARALGDRNYTAKDIRQALAGVSTTVWQAEDPRILEQSIVAVIQTLAKEFYIVFVSGTLCMLSRLLMRRVVIDHE